MEDEELQELCRRAAVEQDSAKLLELVRQINDRLAKQEHAVAGAGMSIESGRRVNTAAKSRFGTNN